MGTYQQGILGNFQGKIGTVIGSSWRGINYMRGLSSKSSRPATTPQLVQRERFKVMTKFMAKLSSLVMITFNDPSKRATGTNNAVSYNVKEAIAGAYPNFTVDYPRVALSQGILHNVYNPAATAAGNGIVKFDWTPNTGANANDTDKCIAVIYCPETEQAVYSPVGGAPRSAGADELAAVLFTGKTVETWIFFASATGSAISTSAYTGQVVVA